MIDKDFRENISNQVISITLEDGDTDVECRACNYLSEDDNDYETDGDMLCDDCKREVEQCYQKYSNDRRKGSKFSNERFDRKKIIRESASFERRLERKPGAELCSCKVQTDSNLNQKISRKREAELLSKRKGVEKENHHSSECLKYHLKARKKYRTKETDGSVTSIRRSNQPKECKCCSCDTIQSIINKTPSEHTRNQKHQENKDSNSCRKTFQSCNLKNNATSCGENKKKKYDLCERLNHNFDEQINKYKYMNKSVDENQCDKSNMTKESQLYERKGLEMKNQRSYESITNDFKESEKKYETKESDCSEKGRNRPKESNYCSCNMNHSMKRSSTVEHNTNKKFQERKRLNCQRAPSQSCNDLKYADFIKSKDPEKNKDHNCERIKHDEDRKNIQMKISDSVERKKYQIKESNSTECKNYRRNKSESTESRIHQRIKSDRTKRKKYRVKECDSNERVVYQPKESNSFSIKTVPKSNAIKRSKTEHYTNQKYREKKESNHRRRTLQGCSSSTRAAELIKPKDFQNKKYGSCESINVDIDEDIKKYRAIDHDRMTMHAKDSNMGPCKTRGKSDTPEKSESGERSSNPKCRAQKASNDSNNLIQTSKKEDELVMIKTIQKQTQHSDDRVSYNEGRNKHCQKESACNEKNESYSCKRCSEIYKYDNNDYKPSKDQKIINKIDIRIDPQLESNDQNDQCHPLDKCNWPLCDKCRKRKDPQKKKKKYLCAMKIQKYLEHCLKAPVELKCESKNSVYSRKKTEEEEKSTEFICKCVPKSRKSNQRQRKQIVLSDEEIEPVRKNRAGVDLSQDSNTCGSCGEVTDNSCSSAGNKGMNQNNCSITSQDERNNQITAPPSNSKICIYSMPKKKRRENNGELPIRYKTCEGSVCKNKARGMKGENCNANYLKVREICERLKDIRKQFSDTKKHQRRDTSASYSPEFLSNSQASFHNHRKCKNVSKSSINREKDRGCISQACQTEFVCKCLSNSKNLNHRQRNQTPLSDVEIETVNIESCKANNELHQDHKKKRLKQSEQIMRRSRDSNTDEDHEHDRVKEYQPYKSPRNSNTQKYSSQRICSKINSPSFKKRQPRIGTIREQHSLHEDENGKHGEESSREKILYICENRKVSKCYMKQKESKDRKWDNEKESKNMFEREFQKLQKNLKKDKKNKPSIKNGRTCDKLKARIEKYCNCSI